MDKDAGAFQRPRRAMSRKWIWMVVALAFPAGGVAQSKPQFPQDDFQVWTDVEASHALGENLHLNLNGALRWSNDAGHLLYRRMGGGFAYTWHKYLTFSPYYNFYAADPTPVTTSHENRASFAVTVGIPLGRWRVSDRNTIERRFLATADTTRYRNRVQIERAVKFGGFPLHVFVWDEVFYDSGASAWTRNRAAVGAGKEISHYLSIDLYYLHQNDSHTRPGDLNGVGVTLRTHF